MEFLDYKKRFVKEGDQTLEAHSTYVVSNASKNPQFPDWLSNDTEQRLKDFQVMEYPGLTYLREGRLFSIHMIANASFSGHVDYFERALQEACPTDYVDVIHRDLPEK